MKAQLQFVRWFFLCLLKTVAIVTGAFIAYAAWIVVSTPDVSKIKTCLITKKYQVSLCEKNKGYARLAHVSDNLKNLILIAEDSGFYYHNGFDWSELKSSFESNLGLLRAARGGSTITQQLAKNVFLPFDKTLSRKIREAILTVNLEKILLKPQIFEKYLNVIELGPHIYGVNEASWHYFNKAPNELNILESAFLTYLIPNPKSHYHSFKNKKLSHYARKRILDLCYRLYRFHRITEDQYFAAKENIDEFPWVALSEVQLARLKGLPTGGGTPDPVTSVNEENILPNFNSTEAVPELSPPESETAE